MPGSDRPPRVSWVGQRPQQFARAAASKNRTNNSDPEQLPIRPAAWTARPVTGGQRRPAVLKGTVLGALVVSVVAPVVR